MNAGIDMSLLSYEYVRFRKNCDSTGHCLAKCNVLTNVVQPLRYYFFSHSFSRLTIASSFIISISFHQSDG